MQIHVLMSFKYLACYHGNLVTVYADAHKM